MTLDRSMDLRWQQETIQQWLNTPGIPVDAREGLLLMLTRVKEELLHTYQVRCSDVSKVKDSLGRGPRSKF